MMQLCENNGLQKFLHYKLATQEAHGVEIKHTCRNEKEDHTEPNVTDLTVNTKTKECNATEHK
jgi:hypothetical protein